jgi:2-octaprenylphenol hydroxylase
MTDNHTSPEALAPTSLHYDLVIIGAGMIGSAMACALACDKRGEKISIAVIDAGKPPTIPAKGQYDARVVALTHASQQLFESIHIWDEIALERACPYTDMHVWDGDGTGHIHFDCRDVQRNELGHIVENSLIANALQQKMNTLQQVDLLQPVCVESLQHDTESGSPILLLEDGRLVHAGLVIAADGAHSKLRQLAGFRTREWDYEHQAIVTTVKTEKTHQHTAWQRFLASGPLAFLPLANTSQDGDSSAQHSSIVWSCEPDLATELMELDDAAFATRLGSAFEHTLGKVEHVSQRYSFPLRQRHATDYIKPGIALIGDAAHTIHPLAGQGANLGLLDVCALRDEVLRACERGLPLTEPSILRRYQRGRKTHNLAVMGLMEGFKRLFGANNMTLRWARNEGMRQLNNLNSLKNAVIKQAMGL